MCATLLLIAASVTRSAHAVDIDKVLVAIECRGSNDITSSGSGVVVNENGLVLTARHVVYGDGDIPLVSPVCRGSLSVREPSEYRTLTLRQTAVPVGIDVAALQFSNVQNASYVGYCKDLKLRGGIFVAGFPANQPTGVPSFRQGVLSTIFANDKSIVETDAQTIRGMSGGPVFSKNFKGLVGLVIGAEFANGGVSYYGILPVNQFANLLGITASEEACYHTSRKINMNDDFSTWRTGESTKNLGVRVEDGFCHLNQVFGDFNHPSDSVAITIDNGMYQLWGNDSAGGGHGGTAQCFWHED